MVKKLVICITILFAYSPNIAMSWSLFETYQDCLDKPKANEDFIDRSLRCTRKHQEDLPENVLVNTTGGARIAAWNNQLHLDLKSEQGVWLISEFTIGLQIGDDVNSYTTHTLLLRPYESYSVSLPIKSLEKEPEPGSWKWVIISGKGVKVN